MEVYYKYTSIRRKEVQPAPPIIQEGYHGGEKFVIPLQVHVSCSHVDLLLSNVNLNLTTPAHLPYARQRL